MTDKAISPAGSPLRRRMSENMTVRSFTACTQRGYIAAVRNFTVFSAARRIGRMRRICGAISCT